MNVNLAYRNVSLFALVSSLSLLVGGGSLACGGSGGSGGPSSSSSSSSGGSGSGSGGGSGGSSSSGANGSSSGGSDAGTEDAGACPQAPALYPDSPTSLYCHRDASNKSLYCDLTSQVCCLSQSANGSLCAGQGSQCPAPFATMECDETAQCGIGHVCCGAGPRPELDTACGFFRESGLVSTTCVSGSSCPQGLFQMCGSTADCATCTAVKHASGDDLGFCN